MSNIFVKLGIGLADVGKWVAGAVKTVTNITVKVETVLKAEKPLEAPFVSGLSTVVADVEALIAASQTAVTADGFNFPADSKVYSEFLTLIGDFKKLSPVVEEALDILAGKKTAATTTGTTAAATTAKAS
jgi:hypothetical protein